MNTDTVLAKIIVTIEFEDICNTAPKTIIPEIALVTLISGV